MHGHWEKNPVCFSMCNIKLYFFSDVLVVQTVHFALLFVAETFDPKKFFEMVGMKAMSAENVKKVFKVLDVDGSGFIEEEELK